MAVAVYVRVSSEEQREKQTIATQRDFARRYCELHNLKIHAVYADDGLSGTVPLERRAAAKQMLADARNRRFDQLLIYKLDRLGRETRLILNGVAELEGLGVRIRSMTEEFDTGTATGRLMVTLLSGFAAHERDMIRERSMAGTARLAEAGTWLGGIVPFGYRKAGAKSQARLVMTDQTMPGLSLSEADVVRMIFRMCATERKSCQKIADHLNRTGIPCGTVDMAEGPEAGKRKRRTAAIWRPSHVRNLIVSRTYMGQHCYGKRTKNKNREVIVREVPALVSEEMWLQAQEVLKSNRIMSRRNCREPYLLRGLIKCGLCGLTYSGMRAKEPQQDHYYRCNGRQFARGLHGLNGKRCPAKSVNGDYVERLIWAGIEVFLRNPGELIERLRERLCLKDGERAQHEKQLDELRARWSEKAGERDRVLALFRRGRIDDRTLDQQLDAIDKEATDLHEEIDHLSRTLSSEDRTAQLRSAETLLETLRARLDGPIPPELKRRIVEVLVEKIEAHTVENDGVQHSEIKVVYRFSQPAEPAPLVLPRSHRMSNRHRMPEQLNSVGDHLRRRRMMLKLLQRDVAEQLGADKTSVHNWEANHTKPDVRYMPAIIRFLGYNPLPRGTTWAERLVNGRTAIGLSQKDAARELGVDPSTFARWERGERQPNGAFATKVSRFLMRGDTHESRRRALPPATGGAAPFATASLQS